jgi:hypothetical protein
VELEEARGQGEAIPLRLPPDTTPFVVPDQLCKILTRDLRLAGIPKRDDRGRTIDVHALRHTFGTLLSKAGVLPRTAQAAVRHSRIELTMEVYTDPRLLDVRGAIEALPTLPLAPPLPDQAAGTAGQVGPGRTSAPPQLALQLAGIGGKQGQPMSSPDNGR